MINRDVMLGITTTGEGCLNMVLSAVLTAHSFPAEILILSEGALPNTDDFYFERLLDLARIIGITVTIVRAESKGIWYARNAVLFHCRYPKLWLLDDDVLPTMDCLTALTNVFKTVQAEKPKTAYAGAVKVDVANLRGYKDYSSERQSWPPKETASQNYFYIHFGSFSQIPLLSLDLGNAFLDVALLNAADVCFVPEDLEGIAHTRCGGEDAIFSLLCAKAGLSGVLIPAAESFHMEKPNLRFTNQTLRAGLIQAVKQIL